MRFGCFAPIQAGIRVGGFRVMRSGTKCAVLSITIAPLLAGCVVGPNYAPPSSAALAVPAQYHYAGNGSAPQSPTQLATWWQQFNDPMLTSLIDRAIRE